MSPTKPRFKLKKRVEAVKRRRKVEVFFHDASGCFEFDSNKSLEGQKLKNRSFESRDFSDGLG